MSGGETRVVSIADRPDLVPLVADWLWHAFGRSEGTTLAEMQAIVAGATARSGSPQTFVLVAGSEPIGTASLAAHDLDTKPDLTPWLAFVFVAPAHRGRGHASVLVGAVEAAARACGVSRLWLFTGTAERLYARLGWQTVEAFEINGRPNVLMQRDLTPDPVTPPPS